MKNVYAEKKLQTNIEQNYFPPAMKIKFVENWLKQTKKYFPYKKIFAV